MSRLAVLSLLWPLLSWAGTHDYYECTGSDGSAAYSVERCAKGEKQRRIEDDTAPTSRSLGTVAGGLVRLESSSGGHFYATALINGAPMRVMVDTGATSVAISPTAARRAGLNLQRGIQVKSHTANGVSSGLAVMLDSVELGGNTVHGVIGVILSQDLGLGTDVLLGMNFLKHFEVNTDGVAMTLRPK